MGSEPPGRFFVLQPDPLGSRYDVDVERVKPVNRGEAPCCQKCGGAIGMMTWQPPHRANLMLHGEELGDFMEASGHDLLVSERFARLFRQEGLTGLEGFHPVEVLRVRRKQRGPTPSHVPHFLLVRASLGRAAVDMTRSRIPCSRPPTCEECRYMHMDSIHGFTLEPGSWQGEDVFRPRGLYGFLTVSERFERFVARHGFANIRLTPTEAYEWNPSTPRPEIALKQGAN
jgi:hypothetical protein